MSVAPRAVPARYYPAGGDAHGRPVHLAWHDGRLVVQRADAPAVEVDGALLRIDARGFNHGQWAIAWHGDDGEHLLIVADADIAPLRAAAPAPFAAGGRTRARGTRRFAAGIAALAAIAALVAGGLLYALEPLAERIVDHIPSSVETGIGAVVLARTQAESRLIDSGPAHDALQAIGRRLARPGEPLQFFLADRPDVNAFAAPGGIVVVHRGLMAQAGAAEEVAGVLAHEIAHVELRHSLRQLVRSAGLQAAFALLAGDYAILADGATRLGELKFSRDAEREADARGLQRLDEARIDARGLVRFFERLEKAGGELPALLSTHPATAERIASLRDALARRQAAPTEALAIDWQPVLRALSATPRPSH